MKTTPKPRSKRPYDYLQALCLSDDTEEGAPVPTEAEARRVLRKLVRVAVMEACGPPGDIGEGNSKRVEANRIAKELVP